MKYLFLLFCFCACQIFSNAQLSTADSLSDGRPPDSGIIKKGIPDGVWKSFYNNGNTRFLRTYSFDKWKQFQNEKSRYHPKRVSLYITKLFHENRKQAEKYITAINSFCAKENCTGVNAPDDTEHYHPPFKNGFLHGAFANYFPDGAVKDTGHYKNGLPEGIWIKWTGDKQFYWKGNYQHGLKDQEWKLYSSAGKLLRILFYRDGKFVWRKDMKDGIELTQEELPGF